MSYIKSTFEKIERLNEVKRINELELEGTSINGDVFTFKVGNWKFDSGVHNCPINFTLTVRINGVYGHRYDFAFLEEQKEFQQNWIKIMARLQLEEFKLEDAARDNANNLWHEL